MARFRRGMGLRPIDSSKNVVDLSSVLVATTNTVIQDLIEGVNLANRENRPNEVTRGRTVKGFFLSLFFASDENTPSPGSIPLLDWYCIVDRGGVLSKAVPTFGNTNEDYPIPGATGTAVNVNKIIHEEKGLIGEKNDGSKMVFQGVIRIPRGMQKINAGDKITIIGRANDEAVFCLKCIYKSYG